MKTVSEIIDQIGRDAVMCELQVEPPAIRKAIRENKAPAAWFDAMERLTGSALDRSLFNFKGLP